MLLLGRRSVSELILGSRIAGDGGAFTAADAFVTIVVLVPVLELFAPVPLLPPASLLNGPRYCWWPLLLKVTCRPPWMLFKRCWSLILLELKTCLGRAPRWFSADRLSGDEGSGWSVEEGLAQQFQSGQSPIEWTASSSFLAIHSSAGIFLSWNVIAEISQIKKKWNQTNQKKERERERIGKCPNSIN